MGMTPSLIKLSALLLCMTVIVTSLGPSQTRELPTWATEATDASGSEPVRSAITDALAALVLQYAMYDREAQKTLLSDLAHLYRNHRKGFVREGLEVTGAGSSEANGWYHRREVSEGPPQILEVAFGKPFDDAVREEWLREGRQWYESDSGSFFLWLKGSERGIFSVPDMWSCVIFNDGRVTASYYVESSAALPPADGWSLPARATAAMVAAMSPAPTVRVVS